MSKVLVNETSLTGIADAIREKNGETTTYKPSEMATAISALTIGGGGGGLPEDKYLLTGDCQYRFSSKYGWAWALEEYIDKWQTNNITNISYMFENATIEKIPFEINCNSASTVFTQNSFYYCTNLKEIPILNIPKIKIQGYMFFECNNLREITDEQLNIMEYDRSGYGGASRIVGCYSLRRISTKLLNNLWDTYNSSFGSCYGELFNNCYTLDEAKGLGVSTATFTGNMFSGMATNTYRLKDLTFMTNEDGTPQTANWQSQTINLANRVGYAPSSVYTFQILNYNSGITADKEVKDDATYQALKNDPDWFSYDINYSRYNHDSAVNTINSLPDCSATGTNTIKFTGAAGALTDGGAINTLTEEEIAVATAKGWTVSLA